MAGTYLDAIGAFHRSRAQQDVRDWRERDVVSYVGASFREAINSSTTGTVRVIAEIKRRSPSKGWLAQDLDAAVLAKTYEAAGAAAISVLTDREYFGARADDLSTVAATVAIPRLRKDFTVSENDVLDAVEWGASAILLIVALLSDAELVAYRELAERFGIEALVEVHDAEEASRAVASGATIIGVNQRNLHTFAVDSEHAARVATSLPSSVIRVAESGLRTPEDVRNAGSSGFDAVLVGETFVTNADPGSTVRSFASQPKIQ
jgi:indole-3-glycerol phosphate synthase